MKEILVFYVIPGVIMLIGVLCILSANKKKRRCTEKTDATVVDIKLDKDTDEDGVTSNSYIPVFEFFAGGRMIRKAASFSVSSKRKFKKGDVKTVFYDPHKPEYFYMKGQQMGYSAGIVMICFGALLMFILVNYAHL